MIGFLTSNCFRERKNNPEKGEIIPDNRMIEELKQHFPKSCHAVFVCSDPEGEDNDFYSNYAKESFEFSGLRFESFTTLDVRNADSAKELIKSSNYILLAGGHVPTQNRFFKTIGLRELMAGYEGVVVAISAGTMNSADVVYAQPERNGEALDNTYQKFLIGLGLTKTMILPHYHEVKNETLDGLRIVEDITLSDSMGKEFYFLPDGSYLYLESGKEELRGEAFHIKDGIMKQVSEKGGVIYL